MNKPVKINFVDFWPAADVKDIFLYDILSRHFDIEISEKPDYLLCSCFSHDHFRYDDCIKIFFTGENIVPDFNLYDYAIGFHYITFEDRYLRYPLYAAYDKAVELALKKHTFSDEYYLSKKKFCNMVVSNANGDDNRAQMFNELSRYYQVDSGGKYLNNVGGPVKDKIAFEKDYRFTLAFENGKANGYTTEKILEAFAGDTVPIYWGSRDIAKEFNPAAFINCGDYPDLRSAADRVAQIWENDEEYLRMVKAPILLPDSQAALYLKEEYLCDFFAHIFGQDIGKAGRRNVGQFGRGYNRYMRNAAKTDKFLKTVAKPLRSGN